MGINDLIAFIVLCVLILILAYLLINSSLESRSFSEIQDDLEEAETTSGTIFIFLTALAPFWVRRAMFALITGVAIAGFGAIIAMSNSDVYTDIAKEVRCGLVQVTEIIQDKVADSNTRSDNC